jgi:hypothetical protein
MTIKPSSLAALLCTALLLSQGLLQAQPSTMPDNATTVPPELGVKPPLQGASAAKPADLKPRMRPELKPRLNSDELIPEMRTEQRPEMSPGMQPNSQKPLRTDAPTKRVN